MPGPLAGRTIALPETRELDRLAELLEGQGATALRCPLLSILDAPDPAPAEAWLRELCAGRFDDVIFLTGEGLRRLLALAERAGLREQVVAALGRVRRITRGPKPARALHEIGLASDLPAAVPTSQGVIESLRPLDLRGRRVALQLYGQEPNRELVSFLEQAGATVTPVAPYVYAPASDDQKVSELLSTMAAGKVDAIAFTSGGQVDRLWQVVEARGLQELVATAFSHTKVAAIGPIVVEALRKRGVRIDIVPDKQFVMRRLIDLLVEGLAPRPV